jgi:formylglycine-generating enzyme required for sulfatase activity
VATSWQNVEFLGQKVSFAPDHPVVNVSHDDAKAFCAWLTAKERQEGRLPAGASYRLPTDLEWSAAVGLPKENGATPEARDMKLAGVYPWGNQFPPPQGAGNFADITSGAAFGTALTFIQGYRDGFATTSPVGSFAANSHGLFDLSGNVWEWCEDFFDGKNGARVLRGGSCGNDDAGYLLSSFRVDYTPGARFGLYGFRCVLVGGQSR